MKKLFSIIALTASLAVTMMSSTSCEEFLNEAPNSDQPKEYIFEDYLRAQRYLDMIYYYMNANWVGDGKFGGNYGMLESATDMSEYTADYGVPNKSFNIGNWKHSSADYEVGDTWFRDYKQIRKCWMMLDNFDNPGNFNNEPEGRKPLMKGECHFMLAYYYFELYKRYGGVPLVKQVLDLESDYKIPRSTEAEVVEFILSELALSESLVPDEWPSEDYGRVTKAWCKALRSRVTLYDASPLHNPNGDKAKWQKAIDAAKDCLQYCATTGYHTLYHDYQNIFMRTTPDKVSEIIVFKRAGTYNTTFNSKLVHYEQATPGDDFWGYASNAPSQNLVDRYPVIVFDADGNAIGTEQFDWNNPKHVENIYKNRDPRFYYTILYNGRTYIHREIQTWKDGTTYGADRDPKNQLYSKTGYYLRKFWPRECKDKNMPGSQKVYGFYIRLAEIYLNYAEAMNELYGPDDPQDYISAIEATNKLRERLVCPASEDITSSSPYSYVKVERDENPDFPVLPNGMPGIRTGLSKEEAREAIHNERAIEFAFEDQYFYDILRWKEGDKHIGTTVYKCEITKNTTGEQPYSYKKEQLETRPFDATRMYYYPIPQSEVYNLNIDQNIGW